MSVGSLAGARRKNLDIGSEQWLSLVVKFELLGAVRVTIDGRSAAIGGPKQRAVLAMLLLSANRPLSRDRLLEGLWGEQAPPSAEHTLDDYVSRLRRVLGPDRIERRPPGYVLRVEAGELDLHRFARLVEQGRVALAAGQAEDAARLLRQALALSRGPPLADVLDVPFAALEAARLEEQLLAATEDRIDADLVADGAGELVTELERLVRDHPLRERLLGQLMLALYRGGRQAEALAAYQAGRRRLAVELGLDPSPQLRTLEQRILDHDPALDPVRVGRSPSLARPRTLHVRAGVAVLLAVGAVIGVAVGIGGSSGSTGRVVDVGLAGFDARSGSLVARAGLSDAPGALASGAGSLWVAVPDSNAVLRTDARSGAVVDRIPLRDQPTDLVFGDGAMWVASALGRSVSRVDATTGRVAQTVRLGITPAAIAYGRGGLWLADPSDQSLIAVDPRTGAVKRVVSLGFRPSALAVGDDAVWVANADDASVIEVEPRTGSRVARVAVGQGPTAIALSRGTVWVANGVDGTVSRIDAAAGRVTATIATGSGPSGIVVADGSVWVTNRYSHSISRIDMDHGARTTAIAVGGEPQALASAGHRLWVAGRPSPAHRGGELTLVRSRRFESIDPQVEYEIPPAGFLGMTADGLVAWNHTSGRDGLQLVPDLALGVPAPTENGRSYVFRLRPGIRYSDGRAVRASDFGRAVRRLYSVRSPATGYFDGIIGARACRRRPVACRLSRGVVVDDAARTIAFHLIAPDPELLAKLAGGVVVPIPPGTPMRRTPGARIPGTGPYRLGSVGSREITLVRNPRFREWSHAAQPGGNPDRITWRFGLSPERQVEAIASGGADWSDDLPPRYDQLARRFGARLRSNAFPVTVFLQISTRRPPFDNPDARRALSYAVDRAEIAREYGGRIAATPTCQLLAPGIPGYRRHCRFTRDPGEDGAWRGPELRRALRLVKRSGTAGARVTVWTVSDTRAHEPGIDHVAHVLRRLGYRATVRVLTSDQDARLSRAFRGRMQVHAVGFGPEYPAPGQFLQLFLSCHGAFDWGLFCDPRLDRMMNRAQRLQLADPTTSARLWARADHQLADRAATVPLVNLRIVDLVSTRVRGYQNSPVYHFLPAQAEVH